MMPDSTIPDRPPSAELQRLLSKYAAPIPRLALACREVILDEVPDAVELAYPTYGPLVIGFRISYRPRDGFCFLHVHRQYVNLGFNRGADLNDPDRVLQGTVRRSRYLAIRD